MKKIPKLTKCFIETRLFSNVINKILIFYINVFDHFEKNLRKNILTDIL